MHRALASILLLLACNAAADTLLVVNKRDATLAFVDPEAMKVVGKIATGEEPHEVAVSDDGRIAIVSNYGTEENPAGSRCPDSLGRTAFRLSARTSTSLSREVSRSRAMTRRRIASTGLPARDRG